jgi:hypothetical protein
MAPTRQCAKCGLDLTDRPGLTCPACGTKIVTLPGPGNRIWWAALFQVAVSTLFMLAVGFPKFMIVIFAAMILIGTALSSRLKAKQLAAARVPPRPVTHPAMLPAVTIGVALSGFACFAILLFGFVAFINPYQSWQRYQGQSYHRADFVVTHSYFQRGNKGGISAYASGTVDGQKEWMGLMPYLPSRPHDQGELDRLVPVGTSIPIYLFPNMKGRLRVEVFTEVPTAENYRRRAMTALKYGLSGLVVAAAILLVLLRLRAACFQPTEMAFAATAR